MPFGWGANPNIVVDGVTCYVIDWSPMPFGWGANPNSAISLSPCIDAASVTNAFRLGG